MEQQLENIIYSAICEIENGETDINKIYNILIKIQDLQDREKGLDVLNEYLG